MESNFIFTNFNIPTNYKSIKIVQVFPFGHIFGRKVYVNRDQILNSFIKEISIAILLQQQLFKNENIFKKVPKKNEIDDFNYINIEQQFINKIINSNHHLTHLSDIHQVMQELFSHLAKYESALKAYTKKYGDSEALKKQSSSVVNKVVEFCKKCQHHAENIIKAKLQAIQNIPDYHQRLIYTKGLLNHYHALKKYLKFDKSLEKQLYSFLISQFNFSYTAHPYHSGQSHPHTDHTDYAHHTHHTEFKPQNINDPKKMAVLIKKDCIQDLIKEKFLDNTDYNQLSFVEFNDVIKKLMLKNHPDKNFGNQELFIKLNTILENYRGKLAKVSHQLFSQFKEEAYSAAMCKQLDDLIKKS